ncbi:MAG: cytochrome c oxidase subunit [Planctomycetota bacterium]|nr:MAG: cytochrome c oxidase subunit [Planctomycetota bacterium]
MRSQRGAVSAWLLSSLLILATILTVGAFFVLKWRPEVASEHGRGVDRMITYIIFAAGFIFVVGHLVLSTFLVKFGGKGTAAYKPMTHKTEMLFTIGPVVFMVAVSELGVLAIGGPVWNQVYTHKPDDLVVDITAKQYEWISRYPGKDGKFGRKRPDLFDDQENPLGLDRKDPDAKDDIVVRGAVYLPVGKGAWFNIQSWDVLHSFNVPVLRAKQDAVPGLTTHTRIVPTAVGRYEISCAEICGPGHYRMRGFVNVKSEADFAKWLKSQVGWFE